MKNTYYFKTFTFCICALLYAPFLSAATYQSHKSIYQAANVFITNHVEKQYVQDSEVKIGKLDSRLKLKQCKKKLHAFLPKGSRKMGRVTVGVKCTDSKPWSLNVPVTISIYKQVLVSSRQIQKGTLLSVVDLKLAKHNLAKLSHGYFETLDQGVGMKVKRRISAGSVLTPGMLKRPQLISRGQTVTILAQSGNMQVRMMGKALASGAVGERIKVVNTKSRRKLEGIVTGAGEVKIEI